YAPPMFMVELLVGIGFAYVIGKLSTRMARPLIHRLLWWPSLMHAGVIVSTFGVAWLLGADLPTASWISVSAGVAAGLWTYVAITQRIRRSVQRGFEPRSKSRR